MFFQNIVQGLNIQIFVFREYIFLISCLLLSSSIQSNKDSSIYSQVTSIFIIYCSSMETKKKISEWAIWAKQQRRQICFYGDKVLDLFKCLKLELLQSADIREFSSKDITDCLMKQSFTRRKAIEKITHLCTLGSISSSEKNTAHGPPTPIKASKQKKKVCFVKANIIDEGKKKSNNSVDTNTSKTSIKQNKQNDLTSFKHNDNKQKKSALKKKNLSMSDTETYFSEATKSRSSKFFQIKYEELEYISDNLEYEEEIKPRKIPSIRINIKISD